MMSCSTTVNFYNSRFNRNIQNSLRSKKMKSVEAQKGQVIVLDASGGTGKTYTINLILAAIRSKKKIAIATALSGTAATLLSHGRTLHSRCKVPLQIMKLLCATYPHKTQQVFSFKKHISSSLMKSLWDTSMCESIDRTMQDIRKKSSPFGGLTVLLAGDWRQILPVVRPTWIQA